MSKLASLMLYMYSEIKKEKKTKEKYNRIIYRNKIEKCIYIYYNNNVPKESFFCLFLFSL